MKKNNNVPIILTVAGGVLVISALVYIFGFTPVGDIFTRGKADRALSLGRIEIKTENNLKDYFIFLPAEEVKALLAESKDKFLFPQVELLPARGKSLIVEQKDAEIEGSPVSFVTISGLASGAKIYSTTNGFARGGMFPNLDNPFAWISEFWAEEDRGETIRMYFSVSPIEEIRGLTFNIGIEGGIYSSVENTPHLASLLTENTLPESLIPGGVNIAVAIAGQEDGIFNKFRMENILTQNGRIVMAQR